ncbi:uncharacterized protein LOC108676714 [Hyalella azteca]|uniref:Uncharacterized protein LOC108676714 n=1 Tax=Hyalella azteca TaxID=294128 RepID=A0A8B7P2S3_HYAAZ|nr:uncharacterized protein LOC108676714 [Hyalella azteca]
MVTAAQVYARTAICSLLLPMLLVCSMEADMEYVALTTPDPSNDTTSDYDYFVEATDMPFITPPPLLEYNRDILNGYSNRSELIQNCISGTTDLVPQRNLSVVPTPNELSSNVTEGKGNITLQPNHCEQSRREISPVAKRKLVNFVSRWAGRTKNFLSHSDIGEFDFKLLFTEAIRKFFPTDLLRQLGMDDYIGILKLDDIDVSIDVDKVLVKFPEMYMKVLQKVGLKVSTEDDPHFSQAPQVSVSQKTWNEIGHAAIIPVVRRMLEDDGCYIENKVPSAESAIAFMLEIPLNLANNFGDSNALFNYNNHRDESLSASVLEFIDGLPDGVVEKLVEDFVEARPQFKNVQKSLQIIGAKEDLAATITTLAMQPTLDYSKYLTGKMKDNLFITFAMTNLNTELVNNALSNHIAYFAQTIPYSVGHPLMQKVAAALQTILQSTNNSTGPATGIWNTFRNFARFPLDLLYETYARRPLSNVTAQIQRKFFSTTMSLLGFGDEINSFGSFTDFLRDASNLPQEQFAFFLEDLLGRMNPYSIIRNQVAQKDKQIRDHLNSFYRKYKILKKAAAIRQKVRQQLDYFTNGLPWWLIPKRYPVELRFFYRQAQEKDPPQYPEQTQADGSSSVSIDALLKMVHGLVSRSDRIDDVTRDDLKSLLLTAIKENNVTIPTRYTPFHLTTDEITKQLYYGSGDANNNEPSFWGGIGDWWNRVTGSNSSSSNPSENPSLFQRIRNWFVGQDQETPQVTTEENIQDEAELTFIDWALKELEKIELSAANNNPVTVQFNGTEKNFTISDSLTVIKNYMMRNGSNDTEIQAKKEQAAELVTNEISKMLHSVNLPQENRCRTISRRIGQSEQNEMSLFGAMIENLEKMTQLVADSEYADEIEKNFLKFFRNSSDVELKTAFNLLQFPIKLTEEYSKLMRQRMLLKVLGSNQKQSALLILEGLKNLQKKDPVILENINTLEKRLLNARETKGMQNNIAALAALLAEVIDDAEMPLLIRKKFMSSL